jgi:aspartate kinase
MKMAGLFSCLKVQEMKVLKFGGTSVGSAAKMKKVAEIIRGEEPVFVVLSAMGGTTDKLTTMALDARKGHIETVFQSAAHLKYFYELTVKQLLDGDTKSALFYVETVFNKITRNLRKLPDAAAEKEILSCGEKLSTFLFHQLLLLLGRQAVLLDATMLLSVDDNHEPLIKEIEKRLWITFKKYPETKIFVTQGFICRNAAGETDNLGRGGSDFSASLFGAAMNAEEIQIWTDIDGVQNNDPRIVENTRPVRNLRFDEAAELAYFGAKILHPLTILPAQKANIPVLLKNTLHPEDPGTRITANQEGRGFKAVAARDGIIAIRIKSSRMLLAYGFMRKVFEVFETYKTPIDMVTTSEIAVSITIDDGRHLKDIISALRQFGKVEVEEGKTLVGVVGLIQAHEPGYARQLFSALDDIPIRMISYGASRYNFSLLVNTKDKVRTLNALNKRLFHNEHVEKENDRIDVFSV